jgi:hypothetical protein
MGKMIIDLIIQDTEEILSAEVDDGYLIKHLISAVIEEMDLPRSDRYTRIKHTLERQVDGHQLNSINTLKDEGIKENETLILKSQIEPAPTISLTISIPESQELKNVKLIKDISLRDVLEELLGQLNLPSTDSYGRKLAYSLIQQNDETSLPEFCSLSDSGIQSGDTLVLEKEVVYEFDVFISYSHLDGDWVYHWLIPQLKQAGIRVCFDREDFRPGVPTVAEIERAILNSKRTLLIVTPDYLGSEYGQFENLLAQTLDPAAYGNQILPLKVRDCLLPPRLQMLTFVDLTDLGQWDFQINRLIGAIHNTSLPTFSVQASTRKTNAELILFTVDTRRCLWQECDPHESSRDVKKIFSPAYGWFFVRDELGKYREHLEISPMGEKGFKVRSYELIPENEQEFFATVLRYIQYRIRNTLVPHSKEITKMINYLPEDFYRGIVFNSWWYSGDGFSFELGSLQEIWPDDRELLKVRAKDRHLYNLLEGFYYRFLRTSDPIFDFALRNLSRKTLLLTDIQLRIYKNWSYPKGPYGAGGLSTIDTFEMRLDFKKDLNAIQLDSPIFISPDGIARFKLILREFYERRTDNNTIAEFAFCENDNVLASSGKYLLDY